jgi:DNA-binding HxlR family transcriptional regulator
MARASTTPAPGTPARGSRSGRPIMALLDLLGRRWTLRVLWELRSEALTFRALRARCDAMSPSVLNQRLVELRDAGIVELERDAGYRLSREGGALLHALAPLQGWATRWGRRSARSAR